MKLRRKMVFIFVGALLVITITLAASMHLLLFDGFNKLETDEVVQEMQRTLALFDSELTFLESTNVDWASWDDTYNFMAGANPEYIENNLMLDTLTNLNINYMIFLDTQGSVIFSRAADLHNKTEMEIPDELMQQLGNGEFKGIIAAPESPVMVSGSPILTSEDEGPSRGTLVLGRLIDEDFIYRYSELLQNSINLTELERTDVPASLMNALSAPANKPVILAVPQDTNIIRGYTIIENIQGIDSYILTIDIPRTIYAQGMTTYVYSLIAILITGIIFIILTAGMLDNMIVSRIIQLSQNVINIGRSGQVSSRLKQTGKRDELQDLTAEINNMLDRLEQSQKALISSEKMYSTLVEESNDGIIVIQRGLIKFANSRMAELSGMQSEELTGLQFSHLVSAEYQGFVSNDYKARIAGTKMPDKYEIAISNQFKGRILIEVSLRMIETQNEPTIIAIFRDVTSRKAIERKFITADRLLSIGELTSGIAHEINNPLSSVIGYTEFALESDLPAESRRDIEIAHAEAKRAAEIVKKLLAFARKSETARQIADINSLIQDILTLHSYELKGHNIEVSTHLQANLHSIICDPSQIQQVFLNLIINAEQSMSGNCDQPKLIISTRNLDDYIQISFKDNGIGIAPENMPRIFDPFFTTKDVGQGTGLGLSLCYGIITNHKGSIHCQSTLGQGAEFIINLPTVTKTKSQI